MNLNSMNVLPSSSTDRPLQLDSRPPASSGEKSCLELMVAELLLKNQILRFDLLDARDRLERIRRVASSHCAHASIPPDLRNLMRMPSPLSPSMNEY